jgi:hypothetical protein
VTIKTGGDATFAGANVHGDEALNMEIGGDLNVESLQDTDYAKGSNWGVNVGIGSNSAGGGFNVGSSDHDSAWVNNQTSLTGGNVDINVAGKTEITGGLLAAGEYDENGKLIDNGNLNLSTNELVYNDLHDFNTSNESGFGIQSNWGSGTDKKTGNEHSSGTTSITLKDKGSETEQTTHATIGSGAITVGGTQLSNDDPALAGLNRNTDNAQEVTKDMTTGALDGTATIDNRWFSGAGRENILNQHKDFVGNLNTAAKDASVAPIAIGGIAYGIAGTLLNSDGQIIAGENGNLHFLGNILGPDSGAINLGGAINYYGDAHPDDVGVQYRSPYNVILGYHEEAHTDQWREMSSPVFLWNWIKGGGPDYNNPIENHSSGGANDRAKDRMQNENIFDIFQKSGAPKKAGVYK